MRADTELAQHVVVIAVFIDLPATLQDDTSMLMRLAEGPPLKPLVENRYFISGDADVCLDWLMMSLPMMPKAASLAGNRDF